MTANQIAYWKLQEEKRSNVTKEGETNRHNLVTERETERSNKAQESISWFSANETKRSNLAKETETNRHNVTVEQEDRRHHGATEQQARDELVEKSRSNRANEAINLEKNAIGWYTAEENRRSNLAREAETHRSNVASENLGYANLQEGRRANLAREQYQVWAKNEDVRMATATLNTNARLTREKLQLQGEQNALGWATLSNQEQRVANDYEVGKEGNAIQQEGNYLNFASNMTRNMNESMRQQQQYWSSIYD